MSDQQITTAIVLAAGKGSRLGNRTKEMPKGFLKIGGETIIERSFRLLKQNGIEHIIVGVGHKGTAYESIQEKYGLMLYYNEEYATTESMYTLACAAPHVTGDFLLLESDLLYDESALKTILASQPKNVVLGSRYTDSGDEVYLHIESTRDLRYLSQDTNDKINAYAELVGISKISYEYFQELITLPTIKKIKYEYGFNALAPKSTIYVEKQANLVWCEIDNEAHLERALTKIYPHVSK